MKNVPGRRHPAQIVARIAFARDEQGGVGAGPRQSALPRKIGGDCRQQYARFLENGGACRAVSGLTADYHTRPLNRNLGAFRMVETKVRRDHQIVGDSKNASTSENWKARTPRRSSESPTKALLPFVGNSVDHDIAGGTEISAMNDHFDAGTRRLRRPAGRHGGKSGPSNYGTEQQQPADLHDHISFMECSRPTSSIPHSCVKWNPWPGLPAEPAIASTCLNRDAARTNANITRRQAAVADDGRANGQNTAPDRREAWLRRRRRVGIGASLPLWRREAPGPVSNPCHA